MSYAQLKDRARAIMNQIRILPISPEELEQAQQAINESFNLQDPISIDRELTIIYKDYSKQSSEN